MLHFNREDASMAMAVPFDRRCEKADRGGRTFDVTIITLEAIDDLTKEGKIAGETRANLAWSELGIGIRAGAAKPDLHTPEALKQTLRDAKSITYPQDGASRGYIEKMLERMGIAAEIKPRIILAQGSGSATESVAPRQGGDGDHSVQ